MIRFSKGEKPSHRFAVGQTVQMKPFGTSPPAEEKFKVNALMPARDGAPQYRLRGRSEDMIAWCRKTILSSRPRS